MLPSSSPGRGESSHSGHQSPFHLTARSSDMIPRAVPISSPVPDLSLSSRQSHYTDTTNNNYRSVPSSPGASNRTKRQAHDHIYHDVVERRHPTFSNTAIGTETRRSSPSGTRSVIYGSRPHAIHTTTNSQHNHFHPPSTTQSPSLEPQTITTNNTPERRLKATDNQKSPFEPNFLANRPVDPFDSKVWVTSRIHEIIKICPIKHDLLDILCDYMIRTAKTVDGIVKVQDMLYCVEFSGPFVTYLDVLWNWILSMAGGPYRYRTRDAHGLLPGCKRLMILSVDLLAYFKDRQCDIEVAHEFRIDYANLPQLFKPYQPSTSESFGYLPLSQGYDNFRACMPLLRDLQKIACARPFQIASSLVGKLQLIRDMCKLVNEFLEEKDEDLDHPRVTFRPLIDTFVALFRLDNPEYLRCLSDAYGHCPKDVDSIELFYNWILSMAGGRNRLCPDTIVRNPMLLLAHQFLLFLKDLPNNQDFLEPRYRSHHFVNWNNPVIAFIPSPILSNRDGRYPAFAEAVINKNQFKPYVVQLIVEARNASVLDTMLPKNQEDFFTRILADLDHVSVKSSSSPPALQSSTEPDLIALPPVCRKRVSSEPLDPERNPALTSRSTFTHIPTTPLPAVEMRSLETSLIGVCSADVVSEAPRPERRRRRQRLGYANTSNGLGDWGESFRLDPLNTWNVLKDDLTTYGITPDNPTFTNPMPFSTARFRDREKKEVQEKQKHFALSALQISGALTLSRVAIPTLRDFDRGFEEMKLQLLQKSNCDIPPKHRAEILRRVRMPHFSKMNPTKHRGHLNQRREINSGTRGALNLNFRRRDFLSCPDAQYASSLLSPLELCFLRFRIRRVMRLMKKCGLRVSGCDGSNRGTDVVVYTQEDAVILDALSHMQKTGTLPPEHSEIIEIPKDGTPVPRRRIKTDSKTLSATKRSHLWALSSYEAMLGEESLPTTTNNQRIDGCALGPPQTPIQNSSPLKTRLRRELLGTILPDDNDDLIEAVD